MDGNFNGSFTIPRYVLKCFIMSIWCIWINIWKSALGPFFTLVNMCQINSYCTHSNIYTPNCPPEGESSYNSTGESTSTEAGMCLFRMRKIKLWYTLTCLVSSALQIKYCTLMGNTCPCHSDSSAMSHPVYYYNPDHQQRPARTTKHQWPRKPNNTTLKYFIWACGTDTWPEAGARQVQLTPHKEEPLF